MRRKGIGEMEYDNNTLEADKWMDAWTVALLGEFGSWLHRDTEDIRNLAVVSASVGMYGTVRYGPNIEELFSMLHRLSESIPHEVRGIARKVPEVSIHAKISVYLSGHTVESGIYELLHRYGYTGKYELLPPMAGVAGMIVVYEHPEFAAHFAQAMDGGDDISNVNVMGIDVTHDMFISSFKELSRDIFNKVVHNALHMVNGDANV